MALAFRSNILRYGLEPAIKRSREVFELSEKSECEDDLNSSEGESELSESPHFEEVEDSPDSEEGYGNVI